MSGLNLSLAADLQQETFLTLAINFLMCAILAFTLRSFYIRYSKSLSSKNHIATILPMLSLVIFLVIAVVKSSLALSLGLVGALSIVRFRTPIKEPEELVYLFLAIAVGLGMGAGFTLLTTSVVISILGLIYLFLRGTEASSANDFNLILNWNDPKVSHADVLDICSKFCSAVAILRIADSQIEKSCVVSATLLSDRGIDDIISALRARSDAIEINMHHANTNW